MTVFVWADPDAGADEMIGCVGTEPDVREYAAKYGSGYPNSIVYALVPSGEVANLRRLASVNGIDEWAEAEAFTALAGAVLAALPEVSG